MMIPFYNVCFTNESYDGEKFRCEDSYYCLTTALKVAKTYSRCVDIVNSTVDVVDGTTGEVVATYIDGCTHYIAPDYTIWNEEIENEN